jgi:hypothetical protein
VLWKNPEPDVSAVELNANTQTLAIVSWNDDGAVTSDMRKSAVAAWNEGESVHDPVSFGLRRTSC